MFLGHPCCCYHYCHVVSWRSIPLRLFDSCCWCVLRYLSIIATLPLPAHEQQQQRELILTLGHEIHAETIETTLVVEPEPRPPESELEETDKAARTQQQDVTMRMDDGSASSLGSIHSSSRTSPPPRMMPRASLSAAADAALALDLPDTTTATATATAVTTTKSATHLCYLVATVV